MIHLLIKDDHVTLQYIREIINFVHMAQYKSHIDEMLHYMEHTLYRINKTKRAF